MRESTTSRICILCSAALCLSSCGICWRGTCDGDQVQKFDERVYIEGTIHVFQEAIKNKEYATAYDCLTQETKERYSPTDFWLIMEASPPIKYRGKDIYFRTCLLQCRITSIFFSETMAEADVFVGYESLRSSFKFYKEEGLWKIDFLLKDWIWKMFGVIIEDPADLKKKPPPDETEEDRKEWEEFDKEFEQDSDDD